MTSRNPLVFKPGHPVTQNHFVNKIPYLADFYTFTMRQFTLLLTLLPLLANGEHHSGTKVGTFRNLNHGIGGDVYAKDENTLVIENFEYDGAGPDAFFWVGTEGKPSSVGTILPYPFEGKFYDYEDRSAPILEGRFNKVS